MFREKVEGVQVSILCPKLHVMRSRMAAFSIRVGSLKRVR